LTTKSNNYLKRSKVATIKASEYNVTVEVSTEDFRLFIESIKKAGGEKEIAGITWKITEE
jgi:hypothetical protein